MLIAMNFLLSILALSPLFIASSGFFPYISGKVLFIRGIVAIISVLFAVSLIISRQFRDQIAERLSAVKRNRIFIAVWAYFAVVILSVIFSANKFWAFFGNIERGEGLVGLSFFFGFFLFSVLLMQKKEWMWFFKISLFVSAILFFHSLIQFFQGVERPSSFLGNPIFLATYFLFTIFSSMIVYWDSRPNKIFWLSFSAIMAPLGLIGIFITETRGAIAGLGAGILAVLIYLAFRGSGTVLSQKLSVRKLSVILLALFIVFGGIFFATKKNDFWQRVPGLDRIAMISLEDPTTKSRLLNAQISMAAVNPKENGWKKFLLGWGPDNYNLAWSKYYDPQIALYDAQSFDRAHNKIFDVLTMNGLLGLLAYLAIWFFAFKSLFKSSGMLPEKSALVFFGVAYFIQNLFAFESTTAYILFFAFLSFSIFISERKSDNHG